MFLIKKNFYTIIITTIYTNQIKNINNYIQKELQKLG